MKISGDGTRAANASYLRAAIHKFYDGWSRVTPILGNDLRRIQFSRAYPPTGAL